MRRRRGLSRRLPALQSLAETLGNAVVAREAAEARLAIQDVLAGRRSSASLEYACPETREEGRFEMTVSPFGSGDTRGAIVRHLNVTREVVVEHELRLQRDYLQTVQDALPIVLYEREVVDGDWVHRFSGDRFVEIFGLPPDELWSVDAAWAELLHSDDRARVLDSYHALTASGGGIWRCEFRARTLNGGYGWFRTVVNITAPEGVERRSVGIFHDVSEIKAADERADYARDHDQLTSLFTRGYFERALSISLQRRMRTGRQCAVVIFDIDDFTDINEAFGVSAGDALLRRVARRCRELVRDDDVIARLGGDQMAVLADIPSAEEARTLAHKLVEGLSRDYTISGKSIRLTVSAGVAIPYGVEVGVDEILDRATVAAGAAFAAGGGVEVVYTPGLGVDYVARATVKSELREALVSGQFELYYQPKVDLASGSIVGCEALIRRNHPTHGLQLPAKFLAVAEQSGLIVPIGEWVAYEACRQSVRWRAAGTEAVPIAINLSAVQFARSDVFEMLSRAFDVTGAAPGAIDIEVTESVFIDPTDELLTTLRKIRALGIDISLDDFGTGFSSLAYLTKLPLSSLKVDQCFVRGAVERPADASIVRWVVQLADELGLRVIAEGVETQEQWDFVRRAGCAEAQGYLLGRPMTAEALGHLLLRPG